MRRLAIPLVLAFSACQPTSAARFAVSSVHIDSTPNMGSSTSDVYTYNYVDQPLFGGPRALSSGQHSHSNGDNSSSASLSFVYDSDDKVTAMLSDSSDNDLKGSAYFQYTDRGRLHFLETNRGEGPDVEVNVQLSYDEEDRFLKNFVYSWKWWLFHTNERAAVAYDDHQRIKSLDGEDTYTLYTWNEDQLTGIEIQDRSGDNDHNYLLTYSDGRLSRVDDGDDKWLVAYNADGQIERIDATQGNTQTTITYEYTSGNMLGLREAPRLPLFVNYVFGLDGRALPDLDLLAIPTYFGE